MGSLKGRVALITGGASGIGFEFSSRLARDGAAVVIADIIGAPEAASLLGKQGLTAVGIPADVCDWDNAVAAVEAARSSFGGLNILVNNAALFSSLAPTPFDAISREEWDRVMAVNARGPFLMAQAAVPEMRTAGGGRIINIASNTVHKGAPNFLHYVASKGAVIAMTRALARELGSDSITVNALAPGFTLSSGVACNAAYETAFRAAAVGARAIRREQQPHDLVGTLAFLASEDAAFITGQTIVVDGGTMFV